MYYYWGVDPPAPPLATTLINKCYAPAYTMKAPPLQLHVHVISLIKASLSTVNAHSFDSFMYMCTLIPLSPAQD